MPIVVNSLLNSTVANNTFLDKTIDDTTIGVLSLSNVVASSGNSVVNVQREINLSKKVIFAEVTKGNGDTIAPDLLSLNQEFRFIGSGAITMSTLPFTGVKVVEDGCQISIFGHDDTNTVTFSHNDVDYGMLLNGNATLQKGYSIQLTYNDEILRYIETSRNF